MHQLPLLGLLGLFFFITFATMTTAQVYGVDYDATDTTCSRPALRVWSTPPLSSNCTFATAGGFQNYQGNQYVSASCINTGGKYFVFLKTCDQANCQFCIQITPPFGAAEGTCQFGTRFYCSQPPPSSIINPNGATTIMKYNEFKDSSCTQPLAFNTFNQTRLGCFQRSSDRMESATCVSGGTQVDFTWWGSITGDPPPTTCGGLYTQTNRINVGVCTQDMNKNGLWYIRVDQCTSVGSTLSFFWITCLLLIFQLWNTLA